MAQYLYHLGALQLRCFLLANSRAGVTGSSGVFQPQTRTERLTRCSCREKQTFMPQGSSLSSQQLPDQSHADLGTCMQKHISVGFLGCPCVVCNWLLCPDQPLSQTTLLLGAGHFIGQTKLVVRSVTGAVYPGMRKTPQPGNRALKGNYLTQRQQQQRISLFCKYTSQNPQRYLSCGYEHQYNPQKYPGLSGFVSAWL